MDWGCSRRRWRYDGALQAAKVNVLILTAAFGDGHNSAAKHVALALEEIGVDAEVVDLFQEASPMVATTLRAGYRAAITHWPWVWQKLYRLADKVSYEAKSWDVFGSLAQVLAARLARRPVDAIVSTYPLYAHLLQRLRRGDLPCKLPPLFTVVTDSGHVNRAWIGAQSDWFLVPDERTAVHLRTLGVPGAEIRVTGFPVHPDFARPLDPPVHECRGVLYFPLNGNREIRRTLQQLVPVLRRHRQPLTAALGRHYGRLYYLFRNFAESHPDLEIEFLGWTDQVPRLLRSCKLAIGKAGGASVQEVIAAACPMIINYVVPGQEEGNAELLKGVGGGILAPTPAEVAAAVDRLLAHEGLDELQQMRRALKKIARPAAALDVARLMLKQLDLPAENVTRDSLMPALDDGAGAA